MTKKSFNKIFSKLLWWAFGVTSTVFVINWIGNTPLDWKQYFIVPIFSFCYFMGLIHGFNIGIENADHQNRK